MDYYERMSADTRRDNNEKRRSAYARKKVKQPWCNMLDGARQRAKEKGIPFDLTNEYLESIWTDRCPVLGVLFESGTRNSASLDRHVPELGYVKGNVSFISRKANTMKNDATVDEIRRLYEYVKTL